MMKSFLFAATLFVSAFFGMADARSIHGGAPAPAAPGNLPVPVIVYNTSGGTLPAGTPLTYSQPFATGDVTTGQKVQFLDTDGVTPITTQEDGCSQWAQDSSRKNCPLSFLTPSSFATSSKTYYVKSIAGTPNTSGNVTISNITTNANFCLKTSDLKQAGGTAETGTWELACLNTILGSYSQYSPSTGYGSNPVGGWEYSAQGPNRTGIHAWSYAKRVSDNAIHRWIRTDMWVDFWGSGSTPCPCSISVLPNQPNIFGPISSGTVGPARGSEPAYVFSANLLNGATALWWWGSANDSRNLTNLTSANFNTANSEITLSSGNGYEYTTGVYPVTFSSTGTLFTGLTAGTIYWITPNANHDVNKWIIYANQCDYGNSSGPGCSNTPITISGTATGTITMTPFTSTTAVGGWMGADTKGQRIWVNASGVQTAAPAANIGHNFPYLSQKTKATLPFITNLEGGGTPVSGTGLIRYYPNSYYLPYNLAVTGADSSDNRIGYFDSYGAFSLFNPGDANGLQRSMVLGASFAMISTYIVNETTGLPVSLNNGPNGSGTQYPTLGVNQPGVRTMPYSAGDSGGTWQTISTSRVDNNAITWQYGPWMEGSHMPAPEVTPLLKTGLPEWGHILVNQFVAVIGSNSYLNGDPGNGTTYYRAPTITNSGFNVSAGQDRAVAWETRVIGQANYFTAASSPVSAYIKDLLKDTANYSAAQVASLPSQALTLGYFANDISAAHTGGDLGYQPWQIDFVWLTIGMEAWRNEYASFNTYLATHLHKNALGRGDPTSAGVGCLWAASGREVVPYNGTPVNGVYNNLAQNWTDVWTQTTASTYGGAGRLNGWPTPSWTSCAAQTGGLIADGNPANPGTWGSRGGDPTGLIMDYAGTAAIGTLLGISNAQSIYNTLRAIQYSGTTTAPPGCSTCTVVLNFSPYYQWAFGPLGATQ